MKYALSSAQQKELLIRGQPLLIAVPLDRQIGIESNAAARQLAAESLLLPAGVTLHSAAVDEIAVAPWKPSAWPPPTLTDWLGTIVPRDAVPQSTSALICVHVVVLALLHGLETRHQPRPPQWPGGPLTLP